jgi:hypothetical protein
MCLEQQGRNADHYANVMEWRNTIDNHPLFTNISQAMPLSIRDSGTQHPFNEEDFQIAIERDAGYTAGINLFWCETLYSPTPGIPIGTETIPDLMDCYFKTPSPMPHTSPFRWSRESARWTSGARCSPSTPRRCVTR